MARKKRTTRSSSGGVEGAVERSDDANEGVRRMARLFTTMQQKGSVWYDREREGITVIEGFQSALVALREAQAVAVIAAERENGKKGAVVLGGLAGNTVLDPWLAEDLYEEVRKLSSGFTELLDEMCTLQVQAREIVLGEEDDGDQQVESTQLRPVDYLQMMSQELATFEAEYHHIEALLRLISFETSTDELRTLVISWSTSPFLCPAQTRRFLQSNPDILSLLTQRHLLSNHLQEQQTQQ